MASALRGSRHRGASDCATARSLVAVRSRLITWLYTANATASVASAARGRVTAPVSALATAAEDGAPTSQPHQRQRPSAADAGLAAAAVHQELFLLPPGLAPCVPIVC